MKAASDAPRTRRLSLVFVAALIALGGYSAARLDLGTDITNFLPHGEGAELAGLARELAHGPAARVMVLTVGRADGATDSVGDETLVTGAAGDLAAVLREHPEIAWVKAGPDEDIARAAWELYFPRRFQFVSMNPEHDIPVLTSSRALARTARRTLDELALPNSALWKPTVAADPLGLFRRTVDRLRTAESSLAVHDGVFTTRDGHAAVFLGTRSSAFASIAQSALLDAVASAFTTVNEAAGGRLVLEQSGANRFAVASERGIRRDVQRIAVLSALGIGALFFAYFRSLATFGLALLPALSGIVVATAAGLAVFGRLDGLTIAFGASLIGVAIDYPIHFLNHVGLTDHGPVATVRRLRPALTVGALTTLASFAGLSLTSFPGFREIGFFAMVGVAVALATTLFVVPNLIGRTGTAPALARKTASRMGNLVRSAKKHRGVLAGATVVCASLVVVSLPAIRWQDDLSALSGIDPAMQQEDKVTG